MREYIISRSSGKTPPCEGAVKHHSVFRYMCNDEEAFQESTFYLVKAKSLESLIKRFYPDPIIVSVPNVDWLSGPKIEVEIYDDYRE
jgi:hypothetical protein